MMWEIHIHDLVGQEDIKRVPADARARVFRAIYKKLSIDPKAYGKPLVGVYQGYWRLRVDDYRVIYRIIEHRVTVFVVQIGARKDDEVYKQLVARLDKISRGPHLN